jgi:uncharacterized RDD family membrane protein YckC
MATATATRSVSQADEPLDTTVRLVTPERIVFQYPLAGPFRRFFAYAIDQMLIVFLLVVVTILALMVTQGSLSGLGPVLVVYFLLNWGYGAFCEGVFNGQTLGKRIVGVRVISEKGVPITGAQAVLRNLIGAVDGLSFFYMLGLSSMILTRRFQRLGDLVAGTMVVVEQRRRRIRLERVKEPAVEALLPWLPVRVAAGPAIARALSDYVKRRSLFSRARREEMAAPLARPLKRRYHLPDDATNDAVLCAAYHRVFLGE